jgi:hypothetical protein
MNEEQNTPGEASEAKQDTSSISLGDSTLQTQAEFENDKEKGADDYYEVDNPKKEVHSTIGDGEMHDEGLVGEGNIPDEDPLAARRPADDQDSAEVFDRQG